MKRIFLAASLWAWILCQPLGAQNGEIKNQLKSFTPGALWKDNNGVHINAHGGGFCMRKERITGLGNIRRKVKAAMWLK